ncbi:MAG: glycosyltransferase family 4 protein, partial [Thermodesulfobacteriota bacterium]|nr:glycosyltransferase family 4 protein [Thermodesulfobacteriota bacterium]
PIQKRYREQNIACRVEPGMLKISSLPRFSRNLYQYTRFALKYRRSLDFRRALAREADKRFDLVHFNHEALFLLARWLRPRTRVPFTMHIRTNLWDTAFARWQTRLVSKNIDHLVFITENERDRFKQLGGRARGTVVYNIASPPEKDVSPHEGVPRDKRFKIACLSNYSWNRGLDRLVEVGQVLLDKREEKILFVMAGDMGLTRSLPGELGKTGSKGGTLADYVRLKGLSDMFLFLGHVPDPEAVLVACDALAKPTRENNPWGRDILEALAFGRPVLSVGTYDRFVTSGETGILQAVFNAQKMAEEIVNMADNPELCARMGHNAKERVARLCNGPERANDLLNIWKTARRE